SPPRADAALPRRESDIPKRQAFATQVHRAREALWHRGFAYAPTWEAKTRAGTLAPSSLCRRGLGVDARSSRARKSPFGAQRRRDQVNQEDLADAAGNRSQVVALYAARQAPAWYPS